MNYFPKQYSKENFLLLILDSCRWDVFDVSDTSNIDSYVDVKKAYALATFTYPAHLGMYQGYIPSTTDGIPYYDRRTKPLFRIDHGNCRSKGFITFPDNTKDIIQGFQNLNYNTLGVGSAGWFSKPQLYEPFSKFIKTPPSLADQTKIVADHLFDKNRPFFCLINIGETHCPYGFPGYDDDTKIEQLLKAGINETELFAQQRKACEYVDKELGVIFRKLKRLKNDTIVVITSDHGECFGEDGVYGHGIFHNKIMEVPLGIFVIEAIR